MLCMFGRYDTALLKEVVRRYPDAETINFDGARSVAVYFAGRKYMLVRLDDGQYDGWEVV